MRKVSGLQEDCIHPCGILLLTVISWTVRCPPLCDVFTISLSVTPVREAMCLQTFGVLWFREFPAAGNGIICMAVRSCIRAAAAGRDLVAGAATEGHLRTSNFTASHHWPGGLGIISAGKYTDLQHSTPESDIATQPRRQISKQRSCIGAPHRGLYWPMDPQQI